MALRPKFWPPPRSERFGLGLEASVSASNIWPQPDLVVLLCNRAFFGAKIMYNSGIMLIFPTIILNRYVVNHYMALFHNYFWLRPWPQPPEIGLGLEVLASFNITAQRQVIDLVSNNWFQFQLKDCIRLKLFMNWPATVLLSQSNAAVRKTTAVNSHSVQFNSF